jgi:copper homeostasis protein
LRLFDERAPLLEVIACSVADAIEAEKGGAGRLEIIREFARGGLTPPLELVRNILASVALPVRVMLRESDGYGVKGEAEVESLCEAARELSKLRVDGVVLGFVSERTIDLDLTARVLSCAPNLKATFHHAFEETRDRVEAIRELKKLRQVDRILSSGGMGSWALMVERLACYQREAEPEIAILAGGRMDAETIKLLLKTTGIAEFHVGRAARVPAHTEGVVQAERVRELVQTIQQSK